MILQSRSKNLVTSVPHWSLLGSCSVAIPIEEVPLKCWCYANSIG